MADGSQAGEDGRLKAAADALAARMREASHPNCTLYLIWHYLKEGEPGWAGTEYVRDSDKLGRHRPAVEAELRQACVPL